MAFLHLQLAYQARLLYFVSLAYPFFSAPRVRPPGFLFLTERMRLFSSLHPQLSVIPQKHFSQAPEQNDWQVFKPLFGGGKIKICDTLRAVTPCGGLCGFIGCVERVW